MSCFPEEARIKRSKTFQGGCCEGNEIQLRLREWSSCHGLLFSSVLKTGEGEEL
jgi:hypothetical protein